MWFASLFTHFKRKFNFVNLGLRSQIFWSNFEDPLKVTLWAKILAGIQIILSYRWVCHTALSQLLSFLFRVGMNLQTQAPSDPSSCCPLYLQVGKKKWTTWAAPTMSTITTALHSGNGPPTCTSFLLFFWCYNTICTAQMSNKAWKVASFYSFDKQRQSSIFSVKHEVS